MSGLETTSQHLYSHPSILQYTPHHQLIETYWEQASHRAWRHPAQSSHSLPVHVAPAIIMSSFDSEYLTTLDGCRDRTMIFTMQMEEKKQHPHRHPTYSTCPTWNPEQGWRAFRALRARSIGEATSTWTRRATRTRCCAGAKEHLPKSLKQFCISNSANMQCSWHILTCWYGFVWSALESGTH